jgi:hypothetical protein
MKLSKHDTIQILDNLTQRHAKEVRQLAGKYGVNISDNTDITPQVVTDLTVLHGKPFANDLYKVYSRKCDCRHLQNADGGDGTQSNFIKLLDKGTEYLSGGAAILGTIDAVAKGPSADSSGAVSNNTTTGTQAPGKRIMGIDQTLFYILLGAVLILIAFVLYRKYGK